MIRQTIADVFDMDADVWIEEPGEELDHWPYKIICHGPGLDWNYFKLLRGIKDEGDEQ